MKIQPMDNKPNTPKRTVEVPTQKASMDDFADDPRITTQDRVRLAQQQATQASIHANTRGPVTNPTPTNPPTSARIPLNTGTSLGTDDLVSRVTNNALDARWVRQDFPSRHLAYDGQDIYVRPMEIIDLSRTSAASRSGNFTQYLDALAKCISIDIRALTPPDFNFFLYWLRMNTFPTAPMTIKWTSKYGNECEFRVQQTNLEIIELEMSRSEYSNWVARGIGLPTVRDMELITGDGIPEEDKWRSELAQYVVTPISDPKEYLASKLQILENMGPQGYLDIQEFAKKIEHGVVERAKVRDTKFEPEKAIAYLRSTADDLEESARKLVANGLDRGQEVPLLALAQHAEKMREEANTIEQTINNGTTFIPEQEVIALSINAMSFFPSI